MTLPEDIEAYEKIRNIMIKNWIKEAKKEFPETWIDPRGKTLIKNYEEATLRLQEIEKWKQKWQGK